MRGPRPSGRRPPSRAGAAPATRHLPLGLAELPQRLRLLDLEREPFGIVRRQQRDRPLEQERGGEHVLAGQRPPACGAESPAGGLAEDGRPLVGEPELVPVAPGELEMEADDLVRGAAPRAAAPSTSLDAKSSWSSARSAFGSPA